MFVFSLSVPEASGSPVAGRGYIARTARQQPTERTRSGMSRNGSGKTALWP